MFIKNAAILYNGIGVIEGHNYSDISTFARRLGHTGTGLYGFVDSSDNFVDRDTALKIAKEAKQLDESFVGPLYPEDLFGTVENAID